MIKLVSIDIATEVFMFSSHNDYHHEGNLEAALYIMSYLKVRHNSHLSLDSIHPTIDYKNFKNNDWMAFHGDVKEAIPSNASTTLRNSVELRMMIDSDGTGDNTTRQSRTAFLIFYNTALINWLSRKQPTAESAVFGDEFVAMKHGV